MNKELLIEVSLLTISMHVVLTQHQRDVIKDQLEAVYRSGEREGKIQEMERMLEKYNVQYIVPLGTPL